MNYADIGSVSTGTLKTGELIEAFGDELESLIFVNGDWLSMPEHFGTRDRLNNLRGEAQDYDESTDDSDTGPDLLQELQDALQEFAPPYFYFGAHPGDGADFGFWLSEFFEEDFDGLRVDDDTSEVPDDYTGEVLHVNDHGNVTLYAKGRRDEGSTELREVWAIV